MTKEFIYHLLLLMDNRIAVAVEFHALSIVLLQVQECRWEVNVAYRHNHFVPGIMSIEWNEGRGRIGKEQ
jgi:hypothetical protein